MSDQEYQDRTTARLHSVIDRMQFNGEISPESAEVLKGRSANPGAGSDALLVAGGARRPRSGSPADSVAGLIEFLETDDEKGRYLSPDHKGPRDPLTRVLARIVRPASVEPLARKLRPQLGHLPAAEIAREVVDMLEGDYSLAESVGALAGRPEPVGRRRVRQALVDHGVRGGELEELVSRWEGDGVTARTDQELNRRIALRLGHEADVNSPLYSEQAARLERERADLTDADRIYRETAASGRYNF